MTEAAKIGARSKRDYVPGYTVVLITVVLALAAGAGFFITGTVSRVEARLPIRVLQQLGDITTLGIRLSDLRSAAEVASQDPTQANLARLDRKWRDAKALTDDIRAKYAFNDLIGITAVNELVAPALSDVERWRRSGLPGYAKDSSVVIGLVYGRASAVFDKHLQLLRQSRETALGILSSEAAVLHDFRNRLLILIAAIAVFAGLMVFLIVRERRAFVRQRAMAEALRQSEERFRSAFESAAHGMALLTPEGRFLKANQALCKIIGYAEEELLDKSFRDITHFEDREAGADDMRALLAGEVPFFHIEKRYRHKRGQVVWASVSISLVHDPAGRPLHTVAQIQDITQRRRAEQALTESEARYRKLYNNTPVMLHSIDRHGRLLSVSDYWAETMGYGRDEVIGRKLSGFMTEDSRRHAEETELPRFFRTGFVKDVKYQFVKKNGRIIDVRLSATAERDEAGDFVRSLAVLTDVTERERAQEALRESEERFRTMAENLPGMVFRRVMHKDGSHSYTFLSSGVRDLFAIEPEQALADPAILIDTLHPDDWPRWHLSVRLSAETLEPYEVEYRVISLTGEEKWVRNVGRPHRLADGDVVFDGVLLDVTERKEAEEALRESRKALHAVIDTIPAMISAKDRELRHVLMNRYQAEVYGVVPEEAVGKTTGELIGPKPGEFMETLDRQVLSSGQAVANQEFELTDRQGKGHVFLTTKVPLRDDEGEVVNVVTVALDITDRTKAERALRETEERHREFAADVAHELRTPLAVMRSQLDSLDDAEAARALREDVDFMSRTVEQLLVASRLDGLRIAEGDEADLRGVCTKVAQYMAPLALKEGRFIEVVGEESPVIVHGNADALEQAVRNLVENAVRYSRPNSTVTIEVRDEPLIRVIDRGSGIPPEKREEIFQRFARVDQRTGGAGLGLSIVQRTVAAHDGTIDVDDAPDGGAMFTIRLPAEKKRGEAKSRKVGGVTRH